jgi:hypothetical protein
MNVINTTLATLVALSISGCGITNQSDYQSLLKEVQTLKNNNKIASIKASQGEQSKKNMERVKITGVGYGAESSFEDTSPGQRRLMAIRASKMDAYRSLAEQLSGIQINSTTTVSTLSSRNDSFRAKVDSIVRGARVVSITPLADSNYETILEVFVRKDFYDKTFVYQEEPKKEIVY